MPNWRIRSATNLSPALAYGCEETDLGEDNVRTASTRTNIDEEDACYIILLNITVVLSLDVML